MTGLALTTLSAKSAPSPETSTLSSTVSTAVASATAASTTAASAVRNAWISDFSSIVRRQSSVIHPPSSVIRHQSSFVYHPIFVPLRFTIIFYSKIINYPTQLTQGVSARGAKCPEAVSRHVLK